MELLEVIEVKGKLKVKPKNRDGYVRFPKDLRVAGKLFLVEKLEWGNGYWLTKGDIKEVTIKGKKKEKKEEEPQHPIWYIDLEYSNTTKKVEDRITRLAKKYFLEKQDGVSGEDEDFSWITFKYRGLKKEAEVILTLLKRELKEIDPTISVL